ncbi:MAG: glycine--tRNA ligase subunit beta, partial [Myxococcaceae bacterium]
MAKDLLLELGAEELPASFIEPALEQLKTSVLTRMEANRLAHGEVRVFGTPRRLALLIREVADTSPDIVKEVNGPSTRAAFDKDGKPTKAAEKFAESVGLTVDKLLKVTTPKGEYLGAKVEEKGKRASELLREILFQAVHELKFPKSMRWGDVDASFARPLHWIVALLGEEVVPVIFSDVKSGRTTHGHRFLSPGAIEIKRAADYESVLEKANVLADLTKRRSLLLERVLV